MDRHPASQSLIERVLWLSAWNHGDFADELEWVAVCEYDCADGVELAIRCNDVFYWGCGDREVITADNVATLEQTITDMRELEQQVPERKHHRHRPTSHIGQLFCCRSRKMRPQGALYQYLPPELVPYYDACGPEREPPGFLGNTPRREWKEPE